MAKSITLPFSPGGVPVKDVFFGVNAHTVVFAQAVLLSRLYDGVAISLCVLGDLDFPFNGVRDGAHRVSTS